MSKLNLTNAYKSEIVRLSNYSECELNGKSERELKVLLDMIVLGEI